MVAKLAPNKPIKRELQLRILTMPLLVTLSTEGITVGAKRHKPLNITWSEIIDRSTTPDNVPAKLYKQGFKYLISCMEKSVTK